MEDFKDILRFFGMWIVVMIVGCATLGLGIVIMIKIIGLFFPEFR